MNSSPARLLGADITTRRYSAVVQAFLAAFPEAKATLNSKLQEGPPFTWATNSKLRQASDFALVLGGEEILSFHDGPANLTASPLAVPLLQVLAERRLLRFKLAYARPSLLARLRQLVGSRSAA